MLATLSTSRTDDLLRRGESRASALTGGSHLAFAIAAGLVVAALVVAATVLRSERALAAAAAVEPVAEPVPEEVAYSEAA